MTEETISNVLQHLKLLLEDTSIPSTEAEEEKKLNLILKSKIENFNQNLGPLRPVYLTDISSSRCKICCKMVETAESECNLELSEAEEFAFLCLGMLLKLDKILSRKIAKNQTPTSKKQGESDELGLGIRDQKYVTAALQFIICLGILPNLYPGVGIPVQQRTGFSQLFEETNGRKVINEPFLLLCVEKLCYIAKNRLIQALVITKCLGDLLASLIQIGYQKSDTNVSFIDKGQIIKGMAEYNGIENASETYRQAVCAHEREWCRNELNNLVNRIYQPLVIRELLMLQAPKRMATQKSPKWVRQICGRLLSERLLQKNGLHFVINAVLEGCNMDGNAASVKFDMIGRLVSSCPMKAKSLQEYYKEISPQVLDLLETRSSDERTKLQYSCAASHCISWMAKNDLSTTKELILKKILSPFHFASSGSIDSNSIDVCNEGSIIISVEQIHKVFVLGIDAKEHMVEILSEYGQPLFELYCFVRDKISHLKPLLKEILLWLIRNNILAKTLSMLICFLFGETPPNIDQYNWRTMDSRLVYSNSPCGGAMLVRIDEDANRDHVVSTEERIVGLLDMLVSMKDKKIVGDFFVHLLRQLTVLSDAKDSDSGQDKPFLQIDENIKTLKFKLPLVSMIAAMCDSLGSSVLEDPKQLLQFVKLNLERCCLDIKETGISDDVLNDDTKEETISMSLGILSLVISNVNEVQPHDFKELQEFLPVLKKISELEHSADIKKLCEDLYVSIATYGAVSGDEKCKKSERKGNIHDLKSEDAYNQAMVELSDPLIPVRGHSLLQLSHLIEAQNPKALSNMEMLLNIFMDNLCHDDTYIYLAAVQGLVSLSQFKHEVVIPHLAKEFAMFGNEADKDAKQKGKYVKEKEIKVKKHHSPEMRMKIGEALVKATRNCGPLLPRYSQVLLASLLTGVKDKDDDVRASSLSNIGEVCKLLRFSIGPVLHEIFTCNSSVLKSDANASVRQAALLVVTMLLEGLGKHAIEAIGEILRDLYRLLKIIVINERDETVKWHAERALGELESIMKEYLFPQQTFQKKIQIIS